MVLLPGFPKVPTFCSRVVALHAFWFFAASLSAWEGHICHTFLMFRGTPLELSQSHFNCDARLKDPEPLAASGDLGPVRSTGLFLFYPLILASWTFFFLSFVSWALRPVPSWIFGFKSSGLAILCPCGGLNLFNITFHGIGPLCCFFGPWCYDFLDLNTYKNITSIIYLFLLSIKWKKKKNCTRMFHMIITLYIFSIFLMNKNDYINSKLHSKCSFCSYIKLYNEYIFILSLICHFLCVTQWQCFSHHHIAPPDVMTTMVSFIPRHRHPSPVLPCHDDDSFCIYVSISWGWISML